MRRKIGVLMGDVRLPHERQWGKEMFVECQCQQLLFSLRHEKNDTSQRYGKARNEHDLDLFVRVDGYVIISA